MTICHHPYLLCIFKVWTTSSWGEFQVKNATLCLNILFSIYLLFIIISMFFIIFISFLMKYQISPAEKYTTKTGIGAKKLSVELYTSQDRCRQGNLKRKNTSSAWYQVLKIQATVQTNASFLCIGNIKISKTLYTQQCYTGNFLHQD